MKNGSISFALTVVNIFCIWVAGILMFRLKEVAPIKTKNTFWTRDLRTAREANREQKVFAGADAKILQDGLKAALKLQATRGDDGSRRPRSKKEVAGGTPSGYAPNPLESQLTMSTTSMLRRRREEGGGQGGTGEGSGLLGLFVREKDAGAAVNGETYLTDTDDDVTSSTGSAGDLLKEVRFQGLENMADLLFDNVDEVDGDEEGLFLDELFETSATYSGSSGTSGVDHKEIALSIRGSR